MVDFYATWCLPCKKITPHIEKIAKEFGGLLLVVNINIDDFQSLANSYGIRSIPTIVFINNGKIEEMLVGARSYEEYKNKALQFINSK